MATGRFLSKSVSTDEALNRLSWSAQALYMMTVTHLDRDGLITGHPMLLMAQVAPLRAPELVTTMDAVMAEWIDADLVVRYTQSDGQAVLWFSGFQKNQRLASFYSREAPSLYDPPPGWARGPEGLIPIEDQPEPVPAATPAAPDAPDTAAAPTPEQVVSNSGVSHELVASHSRVTPELVASYSRVDHELVMSDSRDATSAASAAKQQGSNKESKNQDLSEKSSSSSTSSRGQPDRRISGLGKALPGASPRTRVRPDPRASPAAKGAVKPDVYQALREFGVAEPALSELSRNGIDRAMVDDWIAYLATQNMARPVGYLVKRLRAGEQPPPIPEEEDPDSYEALKRKYVPPGYEDVIVY